MEKILSFLLPSNAYAELTIPTSVDLSDYFTAAGTVIVAIFGVWVVRKIIKLGNRS